MRYAREFFLITRIVDFANHFYEEKGSVCSNTLHRIVEVPIPIIEDILRENGFVEKTVFVKE